MTSQGTTYGRFQRAISRRHLFAAEMAARELGQVNLADALALTALMADAAPARFERAAVRWHGRFELEVKGLNLADSQLALSALATLAGPGAEIGAETLTRLGRHYGVGGLEAALKRISP
jgi:hypothetical protein